MAKWSKQLSEKQNEIPLSEQKNIALPTLSQLLQNVDNNKYKKYIINGTVSNDISDDKKEFKKDVVQQLNERLVVLKNAYENKNESWQNLQDKLDTEKEFWIEIGSELEQIELLNQQPA